MELDEKTNLNLSNVRAVKPARERFSFTSFIIIVLVHIVTLVGIFIFPLSIESMTFVIVGHVLFVWCGASLGFHRLLSHRSYGCPPFILRLLSTLGVLSLQGGPLLWARHHRAHHRFSENIGDPHSASRGFWWSHIKWMFYLNPNGYKKSLSSVKDLEVDKYIMFLEKRYLAVNLIFLIIFVLLIPKFDLIFWFFPFRILLGWHSTWLINSYAHKAWLSSGNTRPYNTWLPTLLICGEGWHKNHHEDPSNPNNSRSFKQPDFGYFILYIMSIFKLVNFKNKKIGVVNEVKIN